MHEIKIYNKNYRTLQPNRRDCRIRISSTEIWINYLRVVALWGRRLCSRNHGHFYVSQHDNLIGSWINLNWLFKGDQPLKIVNPTIFYLPNKPDHPKVVSWTSLKRIFFRCNYLNYKIFNTKCFNGLCDKPFINLSTYS